MALEYFEKMEKTGDLATSAFLEYAGDRFLNKNQKTVNKSKAKLLEVTQKQKERALNEPPFNGQTRLKNGFANFITEMQKFPENLQPYTELTMADFQTGVAQKRKLAFIKQLEHMNLMAEELNNEVLKYITINKLKDQMVASKLPPKWNKALTIFTYLQKVQEAVFTIGALDRNFYDTLALDSLVRAENIRKSILLQSATLSASIKIRPPVPTDFTVREAGVNSINLYRLDAFRNFKQIVDTRKKELAFRKKYPKGSSEGSKNKGYETEKSNLEAEISGTNNLIKEMKKDRDKHEKAFDEYLAQYVRQHILSL